jgi:murein DD-endopeptidase MepM/ murein hydrolase activator NlpD
MALSLSVGMLGQLLFSPGLMAQTNTERVEELREKRQSLEQQASYIRRKKMEKLRAARYLNIHIYENQKRKEQAERNLIGHESRLVLTQARLNYLAQKLDRTIGEKARLSEDAASRLRSLYMGERVSLLQMILDAKDVSTLLDRMYFKQKLVSQDKRLLVELKQKTQELKQQQQEVSQKKQEIHQTIGSIRSFKNQIADRIEADRVLRDKYRNDARYYARAEAEMLEESARIRNSILALTRRPRRPGGGGGGTVLGSSGRFAMPIYGAITSGFGYRTHPIHRVSRMHTGLDIAGPNRGAVMAADGGEVIYVGWRGGYGKVVIINHGTHNGVNLVTLYGHLSGWAVSSGQSVNKGQVIGYEGSTGFSTGPHLHFEIRENGTPVNPYKYLR